MLKLSAFEFIFRTLPEAFLFILAGYSFSKTKINVIRYIISSILYAVAIYFIRFLPINYGIHTILGIICMNILICYVNKIDIILAIKSSIVATIVLFLLEGLNMLILNFLFKEQLEMIMYNSKLKTLFGLPSLIFYAVVVINYYIYLRKRNKLKNV
jgi:hypothetical protein